MNGKTALVTGSSGGIGLAAARGLAKAGCDVVLHGIEAPAAIEDSRLKVARDFGVRADYIQADLADPGAIARMLGDVLTRAGAVDVLVNNAVTRHFAPVESFPVEAWDRALAVNVSAAFHTVRLALPGMRARGWGRIFNMTSVYGSRGVANRIDYVTSKTALLGLTRAVALETVGQGITCNAVCPGAVLTPASEKRIAALMAETGLEREPATRRFLAGKNPTERFIAPGHLADLLVFLCGPAGDDITGAMLPMDGGWLAG